MTAPGAAVVTAALIDAYGAAPSPGPYELRALGPGDCLVAVTAAPITPLDLLCASGTSYFGQPPLPYVPGVSGVGVVERGSALASGTRVWFNTDAGMRPVGGSLGEAVVVAESEVVPLPEGVDDALAAALGLSAVAAWMAVTVRGALRPGEAVLVLGAGGTVGQVAVQLASARGASVVAAGARSAASRDRALSLGAAVAVDLSHADGDEAGDADADADELERRIRRAVDRPLDLVVDPVCGAAATAALRVLGAGGRLVQLGSSGGPTASFSSADVRSRSLAILGYTNASLSKEQRAAALAEVLGLAAAGRLAVAYDEMPLSDVTDAWRRAGQSPPARVVVRPG